MTSTRRLTMGLVVCSVVLAPAVVRAQHGAEPQHGTKAEAPAKAESKPAEHGAKVELKTTERGVKAEITPADHRAKSEPAPGKSTEKAETRTETAKPAKMDVAAAKETVAAKPAKVEAVANKEPAATKETAAQEPRAEGPRVVVKKVDTQTGMAQGTGKAPESSKLEAALARISDRIDEVRSEPARRTTRSGAPASPRIRLTWRSTLDWPEELTAPVDEAAADAASADTVSDDGHVSLVWR